MESYDADHLKKIENQQVRKFD